MKAEYLRAGGHKKTAAAAAHISLKEFSLASNNKGKLMSSYWVQKFTFSPLRFLRENTSIGQKCSCLFALDLYDDVMSRMSERRLLFTWKS